MPAIGKKQKNLLDKYLTNTYHWHTFRINEKQTFESMKELAFRLNAKKWLVGNEYSCKQVLHSHIVFATPDVHTDYKLTKEIKEQFNVTGPQFSKSQVRTTVHRAVMYCLKDGDYLQEGFDPDYILKAAVQSTKKFKAEEFNEAMKQIETPFYQGEITFKEFTDQYLELKIKVYGQRPNEKSEMAYLSGHLYRANAEEFSDYKNNIYTMVKNKNKYLGY